MTEYVFLKGKVKWFRAETPDEWGFYKHQLWLDAPSLETFRELQISSPGVQGIKNQLKKDEDGYYTTIRRPSSKQMKGKVVGFSPPIVVDGSINLPDGSNPPIRGVHIGNGSDITTKIVVYQHNTPTGGKAKAIRWESSRIDNLIPYEGIKGSFTDAEEKQVRGLAEQPPQF